jgi:mannose-6-phosphate isomerase-like protein (cupin superfamily)
VKLLAFDPSRPVTEFGSREASIAGIARAGGRTQVVCIKLGPGGVLGEHEAVLPQLFLVVDGEGVVRAGDEQREIGPGQAAFWESGERHETSTRKGLTAIVVEAESIELV